MLRRLIAPALLTAMLAGAATAQQPPHMDDIALRYYASLGQKDRVAAEARRLQRLDPNWRVPDDLYAVHPGRADEGALWSLYAQNRMDDLSKAIALRKVAEPDWTPSEDLAVKIKARTDRAQIMALAKVQDWRGIVRSFKSTGIAWAKDDAEALWTIAEAYARQNDCNEAYAVYRLLLANHADPSERQATIEHALALLPMALSEKLIAMGKPGDPGANEFAPIGADITRARISAFLHDEPAADITDDELKRYEDGVRASTDPNATGLVAWYAFKRQDYPRALEWFKLAIANNGDAMIAHGLAHTLHKLGMNREAEEVAYAWREPLVNNTILFIDLLEEDLTKAQPPFIEPPRVARYAQVTMASESGEGAQALGWYAYNTCQYGLAAQWFERANAWLPKETTAFGYALALQRLKRGKEFRDLVNRYDGLFPKVVALAFDDGVRRPPPPCESNTKQPSAPPREAQLPMPDSSDWTGRTMADTLRPRTTGLRDPNPGAGSNFARAAVPSPDAIAANGDAALPPLKKKTDFPFAVPPENPLRFSARNSGMAPHDPGVGPLVARRVPGVGTMPYERYGFTLLPGWDGTKDASAPTMGERAAPSGTLWALQQTLRENGRDQTTSHSVDTLSRQQTPRTLSEAAPHTERRS
jgi:hypothetical protein